jgi:large subunit ribosomal protein L23
MMTTIYDILRRPIITEKSNYQTSELNQVVFEVAPHATKAMIKDAVETIFDVSVERVNIINMPAKRSRRARSRRLLVRRIGYKKAIITLAPGDTIDIFEGVR